ncbi:MAG: hypothetical protein M0Q53_07450 [Prolixibacteraceae bacterium]|jgi:hypothetical protein|nr:hypothetical protein [Prolixibacteraceae bacterium]
MKIDISYKLKKYIDIVEKQTGRKVLIEINEDLGVSGMSAAFVDHPTHLKIIFNKSFQNKDPEFEQSFAHEITHGLLIFGKGYFTPQTSESITNEELNFLGLICTLIDDIVVNKIIQQEGFEPFSSTYMGMLGKETKAFKNGDDIYREFPDIKFKSKFKIFRYVLAWGFLQYFDISGEQRNQLNEFVKTFETTYPVEFEESTKICNCMLKNSVFNSEGHEITFRYVIDLWGLNDKIVN